MPKKSKKKKIKPVPKAKRFSPEQADKFLSVLEATSIPKEQIEFAKALISGNEWISQQLERGLLTIAKMRKLFQIQGSEKAASRKSRANGVPSTGNATSPDQSTGEEEKPKGHGRNDSSAYSGAQIVAVTHPELTPGSTCPAQACGGRLYEATQPGFVVRVSGSPLATATRYHLQKLRCSVCQAIYTAPLPDGVSEKKYDNQFVAMLMINKYFMSMPLFRQDRLQNYLGMPLPASTQWDLMVAHEPMLKKLHQAFCQDAANGLVLCYDDTSVKVLSEIKAKKQAAKGDKDKHTCFSTGVVSIHEDHRCYVFMSNTQVAGAYMADILSLRDPTLDVPIIMCDAISANIPQGISDDLYVLCYCLVHARRQFYELPSGYDDLADRVIDLIGKIYDQEAAVKSLSAQERLAHHKKHSQPIMDELKTYLESQQKEFEPNGVAGRAIHYVLKRFTGLSQFLRQAHAPLDNNIVERALKLIIQVRKSSMFYKTLRSAAVASYIQSALYSAAQNDINPCDYMVALLGNEQAVIDSPQAWLPWHYKGTLKQRKAVPAKKDLGKSASPDLR